MENINLIFGVLIGISLLVFMAILFYPYDIKFYDLDSFKRGDVIILRSYAEKIMGLKEPNINYSKLWVVAQVDKETKSLVLTNYQFKAIYMKRPYSHVTLFQSKDGKLC